MKYRHTIIFEVDGNDLFHHSEIKHYLDNKIVLTSRVVFETFNYKTKAIVRSELLPEKENT